MFFVKRLGALLTGFSGVLLVWNLLTPENEDHRLNVILHGTLGVLFLVSVFTPFTVGAGLQVGAVFIGAFAVALAGDMQPAGALGALGVLLIYTYSKFQRLPLWVLIVVPLVQFANGFLAAYQCWYTPLLAFGHALCWATVPFVAVWVVWEMLNQYSEELVKQNRELLEINKELLGEGKCRRKPR